jgi:DNA helicase HerA-like ATPase
MKPLRFPDDSERHSIYGQTGSGKTIFAAWMLSKRSYDRMPWIIVDAKRDPSIAKIPRVEEIRIDKRPPTRKGLYVVRPEVGDFDDGIVTQFLYDVWRQEHTGMWLDEAYMFNRNDRGLRTLLTQGRSKRTPLIVLSQRPCEISSFIHSESEFKSVFYLDLPTDIDRVQAYFPEYDPDVLPKYASYWRSTPERRVEMLGPCPPEAEILDIFDRRRITRRFL